MTAYDEPKVRKVAVPDDELTGETEHDLEKIFYYGQNDFQPQNIYSVSVGDVAEYEGGLFLVAPMGYTEITDEQYAEMVELKTDDRRMFAYRD